MTLFRSALAVSMLPLLGAALLLPGGHARAGGFALNEMSAAGVGNAHAGGAAAAEDLSTIYYNPAGLTLLPGRQFMAALSAIRLSAKFSNAGSVTTSGPLTGGNGGDAGDVGFVPALYYAMELRPDLRFGIGLQAPFGLTTEYDADWVGRYQALKSELKTVNLNPSVAFKLNDQLSVGAGVSAQYVDVEISRAIDFGSVCFGRIDPGTCTAIGFTPQARDGVATVKGDDWGYGFNFGVLFAPNEYARFGASYRSRIRHSLQGDATYALPAGLPAPLAAAPTFTNTGARADVDLPESVNLSAYLQFDRRMAMLADVSWMRWSRFKELRVRFDNGAADSVTEENWRNTYRVALGLHYRHNDTWKFRTGVAYDRSPVRDEFRTPRVPDSNRIWLAFGAQYRPTRNGTWDVGYAHLFVKDGSINKAEAPPGGTLIGNYESDVNILSVQYNHAF